MAASTIPNLNTLRRGTRGGGRGASSNSGLSTRDKDAIIRSTDSDAATSRTSAVAAGYLKDEFAKYLTGESWQRRLPLMNRGTYIRTTAIDTIVDTFLSSCTGRRQIVSLGAGSDTRYFRLRQAGKHKDFVYHELDFRENNASKIARLQSPSCAQAVQSLCNIDLNSAQVRDGELILHDYNIHAVDLRQISGNTGWLDKSLPTLLISECCLIYLKPDEADAVLDHFAEQLPDVPLAIVIYEPFRSNDAFGQTMSRNLLTRGIVLQTIEKYSDEAQQRQRLKQRKLEARSADTNRIWNSWISDDEKARIDQLEWLDEIEEFVLLAKHYCVTWGWRGFEDQTSWQLLMSSQP